jgi:hypothetical protein
LNSLVKVKNEVKVKEEAQADEAEWRRDKINQNTIL